MQRRAICLGGLSTLLTDPGQAASQAPVVLRVSERLPARGVAPQPYGLNRALCLAVEQLDPGLRFAWTWRGMSETAIVNALSHHQLDLDWDLLATPRRRSHLAFLEGPALARYRLQWVAHGDDPLNLSNLDELRRAAAHNTLTAARGSVAAEFLDTIPDMRWLALDGEESPSALLRQGRWALMPSHLAQRPDPPLRAWPRPWRWMPWVLQDEPVHGAVSLAVPANTRLRLVQALRRLAQEGELEALRHRHGRL